MKRLFGRMVVPVTSVATTIRRACFPEYVAYMAAMDNVPIIDENVMKEADTNDKRNDDDLHLRSTKTIMGDHIHARYGDFGHVNNFIFEDAMLQITHLVVDSHNWFGGKNF